MLLFLKIAKSEWLSHVAAALFVLYTATRLSLFVSHNTYIIPVYFVVACYFLACVFLSVEVWRNSTVARYIFSAVIAVHIAFGAVGLFVSVIYGTMNIYLIFIITSINAVALYNQIYLIKKQKTRRSSK